MYKTIHEFKFKDYYIKVNLEIDYYVENDGIGEYEFWGSVERDKGYNYPKIEDIIWDRSKYNDEENQAIENEVFSDATNEMFEKEIEDSWKDY